MDRCAFPTSCTPTPEGVGGEVCGGGGVKREKEEEKGEEKKVREEEIGRNGGWQSKQIRSIDASFTGHSTLS